MIANESSQLERKGSCRWKAARGAADSPEAASAAAVGFAGSCACIDAPLLRLSGVFGLLSFDHSSLVRIGMGRMLGLTDGSSRAKNDEGDDAAAEVDAPAGDAELPSMPRLGALMYAEGVSLTRRMTAMIRRGRQR